MNIRNMNVSNITFETEKYQKSWPTQEKETKPFTETKTTRKFEETDCIQGC
jgi:hypothetical protein